VVVAVLGRRRPRGRGTLKTPRDRRVARALAAAAAAAASGAERAREPGEAPLRRERDDAAEGASCQVYVGIRGFHVDEQEASRSFLELALSDLASG
jgi:hypothetical protein